MKNCYVWELAELQEKLRSDLLGFDDAALADLLADEEPQIDGRTEDDAAPDAR